MRKEIPILFSTEMVKAILEGRKTMTRRIVKPQPDDDGLWNDTKFPRSLQSTLKDWNGSTELTGESKEFKCRYGQEGDWLWVRETWQYSDDTKEPYWFKQKFKDEYLPEYFNSMKWRPSIFMPKEASRIWLENINLKVERLLKITEEDVLKEGIEIPIEDRGKNLYRYYFKKLAWDKINGEESWNQNPWVWVIEFKVLSTTGKSN